MHNGPEIASVFKPLFKPYRYKVYYGGRGGGKSYAFADSLLLMAAQRPLRVLCARETMQSIKDSVKRLLDDRIAHLGLSNVYHSTNAEITCPSTGSLFLFSGLRINPQDLKSMEGVDVCWVEEAETVSERSLDILIPTIRKEGSEIWFSFNPDRVNGAVYRRFVVGNPPPDSYVKKVGWRDNPWFPSVLHAEMETMRREDPDKWLHIWEGEPVKIAKGAYYGRLLSQAQEAGRIADVRYDPELLVNTAWDLGVGDSTAIWFFQVLPTIGAPEYRFIDYYEASGEGLPHYAEVIQSKPYNYGRHIAPHDIKVRELGSGKSRLEAAHKLGLRFDVCPNIGIDDGIDAARGVIKNAFFDRAKCERGLECLWSYQREFDERLDVFKDRPLHDWTSHAADAFRYAAVGYHVPVLKNNAHMQRRTINNMAWR